MFRQRLRQFHNNLQEVTRIDTISNNAQSPWEFGSPSEQNWYEAIDKNCKIVVCSGRERNNKPFALSVLHDRDFKINNRRGELGPIPVFAEKQPNHQPCGFAI